jgi:asparagine synthase (glutamine-hydrolysing)
MTAIFGTLGDFEPAHMQAMDRRVQDRGQYTQIWSPGPKALLGWRSNSRGIANPRTPCVPLVFAGSILNRCELASMVRGAEQPGRNSTDAELVWKLYLAFGPEGFAHINGQFALALLDPASHTFLLAVDTWASRPLYFATCAKGGAFATEYKALLALDDIPARPSLTAIYTLQATKYLPLTGGLLADIHPVTPGTRVQLQSTGWQAERYSPLKLDINSNRSEDDYAGELRAALLAATRRLISGYNSIGIALSAGLDSTLIVGAVRTVAPAMTIHTFSAGFERDDLALKLAAETARHYGTIHHEIVIPVSNLPRLLRELVWVIEDPVAREEMVVYLELAREAARHVPLVLYGHLSDMLFAGMPRHILVHAASNLPWLRKPFTNLYDYTQSGKMPESLLGMLLVRLCYRARATPPARVQGIPELTMDKGLVLAQTEPLNHALLVALEYPTEISGIERLHARWGLRYGSIFHDMEVAKCAFRIPGHLKIRGRSRKYILRRAAEGILPGRLARRPKDLIRIARDAQLTRLVDAMADELLSPEATLRRGLFSWEEIARLRQRPRSARYADDQFYHLWTVLLTEIWARTFIDNRGARAAEVWTSTRACQPPYPQVLPLESIGPRPDVGPPAFLHPDNNIRN